MANNEDVDTNLDDMFDDADLFADFDVGEPDVSGRSPASKAGKQVGAALTGSGKGFAKSVGREINNSLPRTGAIVGDAKQTINEFQELSRTFQQQATPTINAVKRTMAKSLPLAKRYIPEKLYDAIDKRVSDYEKPKRKLSKEQIEQNQIAESIGEIFQEQAVQTAALAAEDRSNKLIDRVLDSQRAGKQQASLDSVRDQLVFQSNFIASTQTAWMKKMLELKYIHVYTAKEHLSVAKTLTAITDRKLEEIRHNTALPDLVKTKSSEFAMQNIRGRALDKFGDFAGNYLSGITGRVKNAAVEKFNTINSAIQEVAGQGDFAIDMMKQQQQTKEDMAAMGMGSDEGPSTAIASKVGGLTGQFLGTRVGRRFADFAAPALETLEDGSGNLKTQLAFKGQAAKDKATSRGGILGFLANAIIPDFANNLTMDNSVLDDPESPTPFDNATKQTIVEIIPGYLSRMTKFLQDIATGEENPELKFDIVTGKFMSREQARSNVIDRILGNRQERAQEVLGTLGTIKGSFISQNGTDKEADFDAVSDDIVKFITNSALNVSDIRPNDIKEFAELKTDDISQGSNYIKKNFKGLKFPQETAMVLTAAMFIDGKLNPIAMNEIENTFMRSVQSETWKEMLPKLMLGAGQQDILSDFRNDDRSVNTDVLIQNLMDIDQSRYDSEVNETASNFEKNLERRRMRAENFKENVDIMIPEAVKSFINKKFANVGGTLGTMARLFDGEEVVGANSNPFNFDADSLERIRSGAANFTTSSREALGGIPGSISSFNRPEGRGQLNESVINALSPLAVTEAPTGTMFDKESNLAQNVRLVDISEAVGNRFTELTSKIGSMISSVDSSSSDSIVTHVDSDTGNTLHQDLIRFSQANSAENKMILDALLSGGEGGPGIIRSFGSSIARGGKNVLDSYTNIYKSLAGATGKVGAASAEALGKILPSLIDGGVKLGGGAMKMYGDIYSSMFSAGGNVVSSMFGGKGKQPEWVDIYRKDKIDPGFPLATVRQQKEEAVLADGSTPKKSADLVGQPSISKVTEAVLISDEDIRIGLVDVRGNPIAGAGAEGSGILKKVSNALGGLFKGGKDLLVGGMGMYGKIYSKMFETIGKGVGGLFKWATGGGGKKDIVERLDTLITAVKQRVPLDTLRKIENILDVRLPKQKTVMGDSDGDGDRDGSFEDQMQKAKAKLSKGTKGTGNLRIGSTGPNGGIITRYGDEIDDQGNILASAADLAMLGYTSKGILGKAKQLARITKAGRLGTAAKLARGPKGAILRGGMKAAGALRTGGMMLAGTGVGTAVTGAVGSVATGTASALGAAGTATAGALAAIPVAGWIALGVLAVGAAGWGIWNATKDREGGERIGKLRLKAYGLPEDLDIGDLEDFEEDLADVVIDGDKLDMRKFIGERMFSTNWMGKFGFDKEQPDHLKYFGTWMAKRALPVFAIVHNVCKMHDIDYNSLNSLKPDDPKVKLIGKQIQQVFNSNTEIDKTLVLTPKGYVNARKRQAVLRAKRNAKSGEQMAKYNKILQNYGVTTTIKEERQLKKDVIKPINKPKPRSRGAIRAARNKDQASLDTINRMVSDQAKAGDQVTSDYEPVTNTKEMDSAIAVAKLEKAIANNSMQKMDPASLRLAEATLRASEKQNETLTILAQYLENINGNTGELGSIRKGLDKNLSEATKPSEVTTNIVPPSRGETMTKPTLQVAKT